MARCRTAWSWTTSAMIRQRALHRDPRARTAPAATRTTSWLRPEGTTLHEGSMPRVPGPNAQPVMSTTMPTRMLTHGVGVTAEHAPVGSFGSTRSANVPAICPECRNGAHKNCDGQAWDEDHDMLTVCECDYGLCAGATD